MTRIAISPRLAMRIFLNIGTDSGAPLRRSAKSLLELHAEDAKPRGRNFRVQARGHTARAGAPRAGVGGDAAARCAARARRGPCSSTAHSTLAPAPRIKLPDDDRH